MPRMGQGASRLLDTRTVRHIALGACPERHSARKQSKLAPERNGTERNGTKR
jgi:hypothetical protein